MSKALTVLVVLLAVGCGSADPTEYDKYTQMCEKKGGMVVGSDISFWTVEYKCIGDTPHELLPRMVTT